MSKKKYTEKELKQHEEITNKKYRESHREEHRKADKNYRENNRIRVLLKNRNWNYKYFYGVTLEQYEEMFNKQKGCCAICGRHQDEFKRVLHIDHDHNTGKIRGLLCTNCNTALGNLRDNKQLFLKAIQYLENYE